MRITPLRGSGVTWLQCPACRLKCRPAAVGPDGACPRCGTARLLKLSLGGRPDKPTPGTDRRWPMHGTQT
ncbi:hypothetical protein M2158_005705 [Streptomyces sp. SAI-144]|uniref:hypothetical protein n=1 Tax=unclassified Streptomyces TaxID=2593676 RepID=UPI00247380D7|nr:MULTISPECIES: hypothetical protein [unclassified Streptomyces]MDH6437164.1 hypothetical protein [Streptomyces sp. SAI-144]MDH6484589.1 hypothetical protein [Streptomyces sp. SAI-127]